MNYSRILMVFQKYVLVIHTISDMHTSVYNSLQLTFNSLIANNCYNYIFLNPFCNKIIKEG